MASFKRKLTREAPVATPLELNLRCAHGRVQVTGDAQSTASVYAEIEVRAGSNEEADREVERVAAGITFGEASLSIASPESDGAWFWGPRLRVHYFVRVPQQTRAEIDVANGPLEVRKIAGPLELRSANGPVLIEDLDAPVDINTANGPLRLTRCRSRVDIRLTNGPLSVAHAAGPAELRVTNGPINLEQIDAGVEARVLNGPIDYRGGIGGDFDLECTNGGIHLRVPQHGRFEIDAEAFLGQVRSELPVREAAGAGGPAPKVRLRTRFGEIRIGSL